MLFCSSEYHASPPLYLRTVYLKCRPYPPLYHTKKSLVRFYEVRHSFLSTLKSICWSGSYHHLPLDIISRNGWHHPPHLQLLFHFYFYSVLWKYKHISIYTHKRYIPHVSIIFSNGKNITIAIHMCKLLSRSHMLTFTLYSATHVLYSTKIQPRDPKQY